MYMIYIYICIYIHEVYIYIYIYIYIGPFDDPAHATGTDEEILHQFRRVRDEIKEKFTLYGAQIQGGSLADMP
jgi:hypothetical protein